MLAFVIYFSIVERKRVGPARACTNGAIRRTDLRSARGSKLKKNNEPRGCIDLCLVTRALGEADAPMPFFHCHGGKMHGDALGAA
jgi:hypothetical protein